MTEKKCCAFHKNKFFYLCRCKRLWPDDESWHNHSWNEHYGEKAGWVKIPSSLYEHGDIAQMVARKLLLQRVDITV